MYSGIKNPYRKIPETGKLKSIYKKHFAERKHKGRKPDINSGLRSLELMPRNLNYNAVQEFHLWAISKPT
jgi:hypothetical protein